MRRVIAATALATVLWSGPGARADAPEPGRAWLEARAGLAFADDVQTSEELLGRADSPGAFFGIGMHWRTRTFDLGGVIEHTTGSRFALEDSTAPLGSHSRVAFMARWRMFEGGWGAVTLRGAAGYGIYTHTDGFAEEISRFREVELGEVDRLTHAFDLAAGAGALLYLDERIAVHLELGFGAGIGALGVGAFTIPYLRARGLLIAGVEWGI